MTPTELKHLECSEKIKDLEQKLEQSNFRKNYLERRTDQHDEIVKGYVADIKDLEQQLASVRDDRHRLDDANIQLNHVNARLEEKLSEALEVIRNFQKKTEVYLTIYTGDKELKKYRADADEVLKKHGLDKV